MSSQAGPEVPLVISSDQSQFRLMELPPELVSVLDGPQPPTLRFKSSPSGSVALCFSDKTFQLRQVQTSNSVHVLVPGDIDSGDSNTLHRRCMTAISQCGSTLELAGTSSESATPYLRAALPIYDGNTGAGPSNGSGTSKTNVFNDIPLSEGEISRSWRSLCAFELKDRRSCFQPSAQALVRAWSNIVSTATISKIALDGSFTAGQMNDITASSEETPSELTKAIVDFLIIEEEGQVCFDRRRTVDFVGRSLILDLVEISEEDLTKQWQNLLPESWRDGADIASLEDICHRTLGTGMVNLKSAPSATASAQSKPNDTKRKWHEKFKQSRNR